jgi:hypothetical protein
MKTSTSITKIAPALLEAQKEMGNAVKDAKNPFFKSKYADLNSIREAVMPALHKHGISVIQPIVHKEGKSFVQTTLLHHSGEFIASEGTELVAAKQNDPQANGSAISYARRYDLQSLLSVGADDDDGEGAMNRPSQAAKASPAPTLQTAEIATKQQEASVSHTTTPAKKPYQKFTPKTNVGGLG